MSKVVARFYVAEMKKIAYGGPGSTPQTAVVLQAATRGEENKAWAQATPSGQVTMAIKNSDAAAFFGDRLGKDVAITFSAAEDDRHHQSPHTP